MFVPVWLLIAVTLLVAALTLFAFRRKGAGEMLDNQRRASLPPLVHPARGARPDEVALLARPDVREALRRGNKIEAIKLVRSASGLGLREAKELVERSSRR